MTGLVAVNLSPAVADELGLRADAAGVATYEVKGGPAQRFFRKGDVIVEVNGIAIDSVERLKEVLADEPNFWQIAIDRGGRPLKLTLSN